MGAVYYVITDKPILVTGNHEVLEVFHEPLLSTIRDHGRTLESYRQGVQIHELTFDGHMTSIPYTIVLLRNGEFVDSSISNNGRQVTTKGDESIMVTTLYDDTTIIPLDEFIVQMVRSKQNVFDTKNSLAPMEWNAGNYRWKVTSPNKQGLWRIEAFDKRRTNHWEVYTRLESQHLPNQ